MSIILIDDIIFDDTGKYRKIRYNNCLFFIILNSLSILLEIFYIYFYYKIPFYQNSSNVLSLFLAIFYLISSSSYFLIFSEFYLNEPEILSVTIKFITTFSPLIIFSIYFWNACIAHNLYDTYYKYTHNIDKNIKLYKYQLFIYTIVLFILTLFNIHFNENPLSSKKFSFISNYNYKFLSIFFVIGLIIIIYISTRLYYISIKRQYLLTVNDLEENERESKIKDIFFYVVVRYVFLISYFLVIFIPCDIIMIIKYFYRFLNAENYYINFFIMMLLNFSGCFMFFCQLTDPLMRGFILSIIFLNRTNFIENYKENLLKDKLEDDSFMSMSSYYDSGKINQSVLNRLTSFTYDKMASKNSLIKLCPNDINISTNDFEKKKSLEMNYIKKLSEFNHENENKANNIEKDIPENINENYTKFKNISESDSMNSTPRNIGNEENKKMRQSNNIVTIEINTKKNKENIYNTEFNINKSKTVKNNENINKKLFNKLILKKVESNNTNDNEKTNPVYFHTKKFSEDSESDITINNKENSNINKSFNTTKKIIDYKKERSVSALIKKNPNIINCNSHKSKRQSSKLTSSSIRRSLSKISSGFFHEEITSLALINYHLEINDNIHRMIAISISINESRMYDEIKEYKKYYNIPPPWNNSNFYNEKTYFKEYTHLTIPDWLGIRGDSRFGKFEFRILTFCPFIFHHIRNMDNVTIDNILKSLDPINNLKNIKSMKVTGGRGNNSISSTWDKKIIIKTINNEEKELLINKMLKEYHCLMKNSKSLMSRIYGLFLIELNDKGSIYVIVQKNMDTLPNDSKIISFDFKGSTVDRQSINKYDVNMKQEKLLNKYKNIVLKDIDFNILGLKIILKPNDCSKILKLINDDSSYLQKCNITDYSLLVFVHKFRKIDFEKNILNTRIFASADRKYLFNFSIVDFLGTFNLTKKGEKLAKEFVGYVRGYKDRNFSVMEPNGYGLRFRKFAKSIILNVNTINKNKKSEDIKK